MRKKPLRINDEILGDLRSALEHVHKLMTKDARVRHRVELDERYVAAIDESIKRQIAPYLESWILGPLARAIRRIEQPRVVYVTITITEPDCSCSTSHDPPDGAIHGGSVMVEDDAGEGPDEYPDADWCDDLGALDEARAHAKQRAAHYRARGYEVRTAEVRR